MIDKDETQVFELSKYSLYKHLKAFDVLAMLKPLLDGGGYQLRLVDGKIEMKNPQMAKDTPWIHVRHKTGFNCGLWHQIYFDVVSMSLPADERFVPRHCQDCYKVVVKPRTLKQLFELLKIQKALNHPAKCGIEPRESVHGLYGGYFYNKGLQAGTECYHMVCNALFDNDLLAPLLEELDERGKTTRVLLKRACTEYEHACGPSDKWEVTPEQKIIEDRLEQYLVIDEMNLRQPEHVIFNVQRRWIEWAWKNGDPTYAEFTGGEPLYPAYVTYHPPIGRELDYACSSEKPQTENAERKRQSSVQNDGGGNSCERSTLYGALCWKQSREGEAKNDEGKTACEKGETENEKDYQKCEEIAH